jgi:folylpolyglutamate synthase/dihydropteroate synthase
VSAIDLINTRSQLAAGFVAPRSGNVAVAAAGLERMRRLVDALGGPHRAFKTIHVAGSKGKGSTAAYAAAILTATGRKTGRYTSPHLMDWRERISVDGVDVSRRGLRPPPRTY